MKSCSIARRAAASGLRLVAAQDLFYATAPDQPDLLRLALALLLQDPEHFAVRHQHDARELDELRQAGRLDPVGRIKELNEPMSIWEWNEGLGLLRD